MTIGNYILFAGTGSTSWTYNINKFTQQNVESLLRIALDTGRLKDPELERLDLENLVKDCTQRFNNSIVFDPRENLMAYTLRDPVSSPGGAQQDVRTSQQPRGTAQKIEVKSRYGDLPLENIIPQS